MLLLITPLVLNCTGTRAKYPFCRYGTLDVMGDHAVCHAMVGGIWAFIMILYETKLYQLAQDFLCLPSVNRRVCYPTTIPDRSTFLTWMECQSTTSNRRYRHFLAVKPYKGVEEEKFRLVNCWGQTVRTVRPKKQWSRISTHASGFWVVSIFSYFLIHISHQLLAIEYFC